MRILLNVTKKDNFVFFDPENRVHLNRVTPFGEATKISSSLKRAIIAGNVIDVDNEFDIKIPEKVSDINKSVLKFFNVKPKAKEVEIVKEDIIVKEEKKKKTKIKDGEK